MNMVSAKDELTDVRKCPLFQKVKSPVSMGPSCVHIWIISDGQISVCMVEAMPLMVLDWAAWQVHGAMALCDKECIGGWPLPVTGSSISKLDIRPLLFQKKVGFDRCCGLTMPAACLKGGKWECAAGVEGGCKAASLRGHTALTCLCGLTFIVRS